MDLLIGAYCRLSGNVTVRLFFVIAILVLLLWSPAQAEGLSQTEPPTPTPTWVLVTPHPTATPTPTTDVYIARIAELEHRSFVFEVFVGTVTVGFLALLFVRRRI